jgi:hypothetical protein
VPSPAVLVNATSVAGSASKTETPAATPSEPETPYSKNKDRFKELVDIILNKSGSFSLDDRLKAYSDRWEMGVKGQLVGGDDEANKLLDQVANGEINQRMDQLRIQDYNAVQAAVARGEDPSFTVLKGFASLSEDDQKIVYTSQNGFDMAGNRQYASFDGYRNQLAQNAQAGAAYKGTNPALAEALKNIDSSKSGADWGAQILSLFKNIGNKDLLSDHPRNQTVPDMKPSVPSSYSPGNLRDRVA